MNIDRLVSCPECYALCGWCSWYAKNAREEGCGTSSRRRPKCEWGEALKGTTCALCGGTEKVRLVGQYVAVDTPPQDSERVATEAIQFAREVIRAGKPAQGQPS